MSSRRFRRTLLGEGDVFRVRHSPRLAAKTTKESKGTPPRPWASPGVEEDRIIFATRNRSKDLQSPSPIPETPNRYDRTTGFSTEKLERIDAFSDDENDENTPVQLPKSSETSSHPLRLKMSEWMTGAKIYMQNFARSPEKLVTWKSPSLFFLFVIFLLLLVFRSDVLAFAEDARRAIFSLPEIFRIDERQIIRTISDERFDVDKLIDALIANQKFQKAMEESNEKSMKFIQNYDDVIEAKMRRLIFHATETTEKLKNELKTDLEQLSSETISHLVRKVNNVNLTADERNDRLQKRLAVLQGEFDATLKEMKELKNSRWTENKGNPEKMNRIQIQLDELEFYRKKLEKEVKGVRESLADCKKNKEIAISEMRDDLVESLANALNGNSDGKFPNLDSVIEKLKRSALSEEDFRIMANRLKDNLVDEVQKEVYDQGVFNQRVESAVLSENLQINRNDRLEFSKEDLEAIVNRKLGVYDADKTGQFDFALESAGGLIESTRCTRTYDKSAASYSVMGIQVWSETTDPKMILRPGTHPGQCWAFKGNEGSVVIRLSSRIKVRSVALEHVPAILSPDGRISSAPKSFEVWGLSTLNDPDPMLLGNFTYLDNNQPIQNFATVADSDRFFDLVEVSFLSNHGHSSYTCIYRVRVHGSLG